MRTTTALLVTLLFTIIGFGQSDLPSNSQQGITVILKPVRGQVGYQLEGKNIRAQELLNQLGKRFTKMGNNHEKLVILVSQDTKLSDIFGVLAIAGKIGFEDTKIYCYDKQQQGMSEITIGAERPYNVTP